ncbi:MAG: hypothetical protein HYS04_01355 [Acidobacteria bacterium]|nr:hypothetical protein [Acidobacteriota bacterium]
MATYNKLGLLFVLLAMASLCACAQTPSKQVKRPMSSDSNTVNEFIRAFQSSNYKRVVDLLFATRFSIASIQKSKPKILWDKLARDYYQAKISSIECSRAREERSYTAINNGERPTAGMMVAVCTNPVTGPVAQLVQFLPGTKESWRVVETQPGEILFDPSTMQQVKQQSVFVSIHYPSVREAPLVYVGGLSNPERRLRQTIMEFRLRDGLIYHVTRVFEADVTY